MAKRVVYSSFLVLVGILGLTTAATAGGPRALGSLIGSKNAILDGQAPLPHTAVLSGDTLEVGNGVAMVALEQGNRMILEQGTAASFSRGTEGVTVSLTRGNLSLYHPELGPRFQVKAGGVTVAPVLNYRTLGEIAMENGLLVVTAKDGTLEIERAGATEKVSAGKTITIATTAARSRTSSPTGNQHIKHLHISMSPKTVLILGGAAEAAGTITAIVLTQSHAPSVSPVMPTP